MISVIVPVHNEARTLAANMAELGRALDAFDYEIIIAEDGSTDGSAAVAEKLKSKKIIVLSSPKRLGRGASLRNAILSSRGDVVIYTDADLSTDLRSLKPLVDEVRKGSDISTGSRLIPGSIIHGRNFIREFLSRSYNLLLRLLFRTKIHDHQCGFKAFRKKAILPLLDEVEAKHWFWDSELLIRAQKKGLKVSEIPVEWKDRAGSSVRLQSDIIGMGIAAIALRFRL